MVKCLILGVLLKDNQHKKELIPVLKFSKLVFGHQPTIADALFTLVAQHCQTIYQLPQTAHGIDLHACNLPCNSDTFSMFLTHH
jgi:hypothetical protein